MRANDQRMAEVRQAVESRLAAIQQDNEKKLEQIRATVDEKLHATLEQRLGESFRLVAERLEQVHRGIGEMQKLASDVGSLSRVLNNVKTRGVLGEVQLAGLLEQVFTVEQYATNVETVPASGARVEFAIKLPGRRDDGEPLWLPIDCKFPRDDYERLLQAQEEADRAGMEAAGRAIENRLRAEARTIREKYVSPPHTTDFGIMFLPTEGLYAEALRRPGLVEGLQREHKVMLTGPTTLLATLTSLQMGFRTLALEKRSSEVWETLGAVKTEFGKFGAALAQHAQEAAGGEQDDRRRRGAHPRHGAQPAQGRGAAGPARPGHAAGPARRRSRRRCLSARRRPRRPRLRRASRTGGRWSPSSAARSRCIRAWPGCAWRRRWRCCARATPPGRWASCSACSRPRRSSSRSAPAGSPTGTAITCRSSSRSA